MAQKTGILTYIAKFGTHTTMREGSLGMQIGWSSESECLYRMLKMRSSRPPNFELNLSTHAEFKHRPTQEGKKPAKMYQYSDGINGSFANKCWVLL